MKAHTQNVTHSLVLFPFNAVLIHIHPFVPPWVGRAMGAEGEPRRVRVKHIHREVQPKSQFGNFPSLPLKFGGWISQEPCVPQWASSETKGTLLYAHVKWFSARGSPLPSKSSLPFASELNRTQECRSDQSPASIRRRGRSPPALDQ